MRSLPAEFSAPAQRAFGLIIPAAPKLAAIFWNTLEMNLEMNKGGGRSLADWLGLIQNGSAGSYLRKLR